MGHPPEGSQEARMTPRTLRLLKRAGYPALGVTLFFTFFYLTFPYERLRQVIED